MLLFLSFVLCRETEARSTEVGGTQTHNKHTMYSKNRGMNKKSYVVVSNTESKSIAINTAYFHFCCSPREELNNTAQHQYADQCRNRNFATNAASLKSY